MKDYKPEVLALMSTIKDAMEELQEQGITCQDPDYQTTCTEGEPCDHCLDSVNDSDFDPCCALCGAFPFPASSDRPCIDCEGFSNCTEGKEIALALWQQGMTKARKENHPQLKEHTP